MSSSVSWVLVSKVNEGKSADLKALMEEMVPATKANEPGAEIYEWFLTDNGGELHIYERYVDSAATMVHLGNFGANYMERYLACCTPTRLHVYGEPTDEVKDVLNGFGAVYCGTFGGFAR